MGVVLAYRIEYSIDTIDTGLLSISIILFKVLQYCPSLLYGIGCYSDIILSLYNLIC